MNRSNLQRYFLLLLAICAFTILPFLGLTDFHTKGEPREAVVALSFIDSGNWILPTNNGGDIPYKPPFFHWLIAAFSLLNGGEVTEYTSRLPSALAFIAMILCTFSFFARRSDAGTALLTALVSMSCFELHRAAANCRVDMVLTALSVIAIYRLYVWHEKGMKGVPIIAIILMGCATLTKGPVGTVIPCLVAGIYMLLRGTNFWRAFLSLTAWGILSLIIPLCWYVAAYGQGGQAFLDLVLEENFGRMTSTMSYESCVNPWYFNIATLLGGFAPWTLLGLLSLFAISYRCHPAIPAPRMALLSIRKADPALVLAWTASIVIFVFYCLPQSKRSVYLMPMYPFTAFLLSRFFITLCRRHYGVVRLYGDIIACAALLLFGAFVAVKNGAVPSSLAGDDTTGMAMFAAIKNIGGFWRWCAVLLPTLLAVAWFVCRKALKAQGRTLMAIAFVTLSIFFALDSTYQPAVLSAKSLKLVAAEIDRIAPSEEGRLYEFISEGEFAAGDPLHYFEVNFYLGDRTSSFYKERPDSGFLLISEYDANGYLPEFEKEGYVFQHIYDSPKPMLGGKVSLYRFNKKG